MEHRGYLTRGDKILVVIAVAVIAPAAIVGWSFLAAGLLGLCAVLVVVLIARTVLECLTRRRTPPAGSAVDLRRLQPRRARIRHFSVRGDGEDERGGS